MSRIGFTVLYLFHLPLLSTDDGASENLVSDFNFTRMKQEMLVMILCGLFVGFMLSIFGYAFPHTHTRYRWRNVSKCKQFRCELLY